MDYALPRLAATLHGKAINDVTRNDDGHKKQPANLLVPALIPISLSCALVLVSSFVWESSYSATMAVFHEQKSMQRYI